MVSDCVINLYNITAIIHIINSLVATFINSAINQLKINVFVTEYVMTNPINKPLTTVNVKTKKMNRGNSDFNLYKNNLSALINISSPINVANVPTTMSSGPNGENKFAINTPIVRP